MKQPDFGRQRLERVLEIGAAGWFFFFAQYLYLGRPQTALLDLVVTLLIVRLRLNPSAEQKADKLLLYSALGLAAAALTSGQSRSLAVWYILALPLGAGFLSGIRSAWKWTAISSLLVVLIDVSEKRSLSHFSRWKTHFIEQEAGWAWDWPSPSGAQTDLVRS